MRGFTIIELLLVLSLLIIIVAVVTPNIRLPQNLETTARQIAGMIQGIHDKSRASKRMHRLHFNLRTGQYWVTTVTGLIESPASDTLFRGRRTLPPDIQFQDVMGSQRSRLREGKTFMQFFPVGRSEATIIYLQDQEKSVSLLVHPITGTVQVKQGHMIPREWKDVSI